MDIEKCRDVLKPIKSRFVYWFETGSNWFDFIDNKRDIDIILICSSDEDRIFCRNYIKEQRIRNNYQLDIHVTTKDYQDRLVSNSIFPFFALKHVNHYEELNYSREEGLTIDAFLEKENDIKKTIKRIANKKRNYLVCKYWYYILITLCIIKNKSLEFSEEEKRNINILHDRKEEEEQEREQLINEIMKEVELWQI